MCYAKCINGELWSWGMVLSNERAPVGYKRALVYTKKVVRWLALFVCLCVCVFVCLCVCVFVCLCVCVFVCCVFVS